MAYITKDQVKAKNEALKAVNKKYSIKARFSGSNSSTLTLKITAGVIDFVSNHDDCNKQSARYDADSMRRLHADQYMQVNHYYMNNSFCGVALEYLQEAYAIMLDGHYDDSDSMTDYFNCAWFCSIHIGAWDKPYRII